MKPAQNLFLKNKRFPPLKYGDTENNFFSPEGRRFSKAKG